MVALLDKDTGNKKAREGFIEAVRTLELTDIKELHGLAETMFKVTMGQFHQHFTQSFCVCRSQKRKKIQTT
jgi:hypothetical protein